MTNATVPRGQWGLTIMLSIAFGVGMLCSFVMLLPLFRLIADAQQGETGWWKVIMLGTHQISIAGLPIAGLYVSESKVRTRIACLAAWLIVISPIAYILGRAVTPP